VFSSRIRQAVVVISIPVYLIAFYAIGSFLGDMYGHKTIWIIGGMFLGLVLVIYDIYFVIIRPQSRKNKDKE
jgi:hypothetical protein